MLRQWLVEAKLVAKQLYSLLWGKRPQFQAGRIAGEHAHESERDDRDQEQLRHQNQKPSADVLERPHGDYTCILTRPASGALLAIAVRAADRTNETASRMIE